MHSVNKPLPDGQYDFVYGGRLSKPAESKATNLFERGDSLAMIETEAIDAVLLDVNLNGEKSYPVADALSARGVPFFFSTGYNRDSMPHGYRDFPMLQKPYEATKLAAILAQLLTAKD